MSASVLFSNLATESLLPSIFSIFYYSVSPPFQFHFCFPSTSSSQAKACLSFSLKNLSPAQVVIVFIQQPHISRVNCRLKLEGASEKRKKKGQRVLDFLLHTSVLFKSQVYNLLDLLEITFLISKVIPPCFLHIPIFHVFLKILLSGFSPNTQLKQLLKSVASFLPLVQLTSSSHVTKLPTDYRNCVCVSKTPFFLVYQFFLFLFWEFSNMLPNPVSPASPLTDFPPPDHCEHIPVTLDKSSLT